MGRQRICTSAARVGRMGLPMMGESMLVPALSYPKAYPENLGIQNETFCAAVDVDRQQQLLRTYSVVQVHETDTQYSHASQ